MRVDVTSTSQEQVQRAIDPETYALSMLAKAAKRDESGLPPVAGRAMR